MGILTKFKKEKAPRPAAPAAPAGKPTVLPAAAAHPLTGSFPVERPYTSEKVHDLERHGAYAFLVNPRANKHTVKRYVESRYKVNVEQVNIVRIPAKAKRFRGRVSRAAGRKKAIVRLREGQRIEAS